MARRFALAVVLVLGVLLVGPRAARSDDVPEDVRSHYDEAKELFAHGDLKKAYSAISKGRMKSPLSVDFWQLYVRIWRGLGKEEDVLWDKIIGKVEAKNPKSIVFDMLRYRLATDPAERVASLKQAGAKKPGDLGLRVLLAREYLRQDEQDQAETILDEVLKADPTNETALVLKGDLMIASGFSRSAVDFAQEALDKKDVPGLHDLKARALLLVAENDASVLEEAAGEARKAVDGRPDPEFVLTLAQILDLTGKEKEAVDLLTAQYAKTAAPELAGRLGELAFRTGDYEKAASGLAAAAADDRNAALALALCEARRGKAKEARAAVEQLLRQGQEGRTWAACVELLLGDGAGALKHLGAGEGDQVEGLRTAALAWEGDAAAVVKACGAKARDGSRAGEEWLLDVAKARLLEKLGGKAAAARKAVLEGRWAAGRAGIPGAAVAEDGGPAANALTVQYMYRHVSYRRAVDGSFFAGQNTTGAVTVGDGTVTLAVVVAASSSCPRDETRNFEFNRREEKMDAGSFDPTILTRVLPTGTDEDWSAAETAFGEGAAAFVDADWAKADEAFGKALEKEPNWARAKLFQGAARALAGGDLEAASKLVGEGVEPLPEDWDGREVALFVHLLAGKDVKEEAKSLGELREAYATRRYDELWRE